METDFHKLIMQELHKEAIERGHGQANPKTVNGRPHLYQTRNPPHVSNKRLPKWTLSGEHVMPEPLSQWLPSPDVRKHFTNYTIQAIDDGISISLNYGTHTIIPYDDPDLLEKVWLFVEIEGPKNCKKRESELIKPRV